MPVILHFCSVFSIRLGSIIVGALSLMQGVGMQLACFVGLQNADAIKDGLNDFMYEKDFLFMTAFLNDFKKNPDDYLTAFLITSIVYSVTCVLVMYGAYKLNILLLGPFIVLEFARICLSAGLLVSGMLVLKQNSLDLGPLTGGSIGGGFVLLMLVYMWCCPVSLLQELLRLRKEKPPSTTNPLEAKIWRRQQQQLQQQRQKRQLKQQNLGQAITGPYPYQPYPQYQSYIAQPAYPGYRADAVASMIYM